MVSIRSQISDFSSPISKPVMAVPSGPIIIGFIFTLINLRFLRSLPKSSIRLYFPFSLIFSLLFAIAGKPIIIISSSSCCCISLIWESFTMALADSFPLESEWQQVSAGLQDSSQYSRRSQQCRSLDGLYSSSYLHVLQSLYKSFRDCTENHLELVSQSLSCPIAFSVLSQGLGIYLTFCSPSVLPCGQPERGSPLVLFYLFICLFIFLTIPSGRD